VNNIHGYKVPGQEKLKYWGDRIKNVPKGSLIIGEGLLYIHQHKLYVEIGGGTFEMYMKVVFNYSRDYGCKIMNAYKIYVKLIDLGFDKKKLPQTETLYRPLKKIDNKGLKAVWTEVSGSGRITAKLLKNAADNYLNPDREDSEISNIPGQKNKAYQAGYENGYQAGFTTAKKI